MSFFETTPLGRILNRFSGDTETLDAALPHQIEWLTYDILQFIVTVVLISVKLPYFLIAIIPMAIVYLMMQRYYVKTSRMIKRAASTSKSPPFR